MPHEYGTSNFTLKELDHSSGHAFLSAGGDIFYSPNCSRRVDVPVPAESDIFPFPNYNVRFEDFLSPRWWRIPYHYFSFIPLRPLFDGLVFGCLRNIVTNIESVGGRFALSSRKAEHWEEVERSLITVAHFLNQYFFTRVRPALHPTPPSFLGFRKSFSTLRIASLRVAASRDWFLMWMSLISSKIADIETAHVDWFSRLVEKEVPQDWLSDMQSSIVCDFSQHCPRVGTFLDIQNPQPEQPSVEWFYSWDIPVWYCPGHGNPKLQPPPHLLQLATTFISSTPCPSPPTQEFSAREYEKSRSAYLATKPWEAYFAAREVRNRERLANETPAQRQTRLNREKKPPTKSADVFLWDWSADGAIELVRERVTSREREDVLSNHSKDQCKYDAVLNVWDVCDYFGDDDPNPDFDDYDYNGGNARIGNDGDDVDVEPNTDPKIVQKECQAFIDERVRQSSTGQYAMAVAQSSNQGPEVDLTHEANQIDVLKYMSHRYGFVPPLPISATDPTPIGRGDWDECLKSIGLQTSTHNHPRPGLTGPIVDFVKRLQIDRPRAFEWDLLPENRQPLNRQTIVECFHKLNGGLFLINRSFLVDEIFIDWQVAVTTSANALYTLRYILHLPKYPSSPALVQHFAEKGIPFHTLLQLNPLPSYIPLDSIKTRIPRRGANYCFTPADFGSYVAERKQLLATPRARAAILRGGIVGRLAKEHLDADSAAFGPSSAVTAHRLGYSVEAAGTTYWDDGLTTDELAIICGLYCCYTGMFSCFIVFLLHCIVVLIMFR